VSNSILKFHPNQSVALDMKYADGHAWNSHHVLIFAFRVKIVFKNVSETHEIPCFSYYSVCIFAVDIMYANMDGHIFLFIFCTFAVIICLLCLRFPVRVALLRLG
jgi:hypothetical protein